MARVFPFQPYRYADHLGPLENLVTQPYDKITPAMQQRYLSLSPYNLVRLILGERFQADSDTNNVYTRAAANFDQWVEAGQLVREPQPCFHAYAQEFSVPDTGERLVRKGFVGSGEVVDYSAGIVHRHEQTLTGPKKDRMELLRRTGAFFEQIFMLYPDPGGAIDALLDAESRTAPAASVQDEYGATHRIWRITAPARIAEIQRLMTDKPLIIADGHHRYETAIAFRDAHPELHGARRVTMACFNMHAPGLKILATHRVLSGLDGFDPSTLIERAKGGFRVRELASLDDLQRAWREPHGDAVRIGAVLGGRPGVTLFEAPRQTDTLDVRVLHQALLGGALGITDEAVREERYIRYVRGVDAAVSAVNGGAAQAAFLLEATTVEQVARVSLAGGVMPQKSTDFYPKLLSGLTIVRMDQ